MMISLVHVFENSYSRTVLENIDTSFLCFLKTVICFLNSVFFFCVLCVFQKKKKRTKRVLYVFFVLIVF